MKMRRWARQREEQAARNVQPKLSATTPTANARSLAQQSNDANSSAIRSTDREDLLKIQISCQDQSLDNGREASDVLSEPKGMHLAYKSPLLPYLNVFNSVDDRCESTAILETTPAPVQNKRSIEPSKSDL